MSNNNPVILFAGDVMLGENLYHFGRGIRSIYNNHYDSLIPSPLQNELFNGIDAFVYNFEHSLVPDDFVFDDFEKSTYVAPVNSIFVFPNNLLKIVNIANNHFWEKGIKQTEFTIKVLKDNKFIVIGEKNSPVIVQIHNKTYYFWGVSLIDWNVPVFTSTYDSLINDLSLPQHKGDNDVWVISIHWGLEFISQPCKEQVKLAHKLSQVGFDIIHGHHPHVFQSLELINNTLVMYSMGNFIFDENFSKRTQMSYVLRYSFERSMKLEVNRLKNKRYAPNAIEPIGIDRVLSKSVNKSSFRVFITQKVFNVLRKIEFLPHIFLNNFYVFKSIKQRKQ